MSRLALLDKALVLILVPLWVVCFGLSVRTQVEGGGYLAGIGLSVEGDDSYPRLTGEFSGLHVSNPLAQAGLREGDLLVRIGGADLSGVGPLGLMARGRLEAHGSLSVPLIYRRGTRQHQTSLELFSISVLQPWLAASLAFVASGLFLLVRRGSTPVVSTYFHAALCSAFSLFFFGGSEAEFYAWRVVSVAAWSLVMPLLFRFLFCFPDERPPTGRWHRIWPWFFIVIGLFAGLSWVGPVTLSEYGFNGTMALAAVGILAVATRKYRSGDAVSRRQVKWVLFGLYCFLLPVTVANALAAFDESLGWLILVGFWGAPLFPFFLLVSVARFNLFDVDRLISAAASYNILAVLLGAGALVVVPRAAEAASELLGIDPGTGQVVLALLLAGVVVPAHRRLRPQIDRLFFKERYALDHGIAELLPTLSQCPDVRALTDRVGEGLHRLLRPEACVVYARVEGSYAPVFVEGSAVPSAFGAASPLIGTLGERRKPLALGNAGRRPDEAPLGPFDRAALETLQAEVVVPVHREDALAAFICLGPRRSGDVYTSTDVSLLAAVAETASHQLQRFDQDELIREGREMQASLRRYVPGAIVDQITSGAELSSGEREVTVLFVDIRGYTSFSESRRAEEIFSTVNRYTEAVSEIVRRQRGSVVEFNGDGMMAVFGAPRELAHKERAAVQAGHEIVEAVGALPVDDPAAGSPKLAVGVGIATGEAFVGNIRAVDRMIWTAIGNTTNLAARLQSLTRNLDAALVVDRTTWERAQPATAGFEKRPNVPIRGRRETQDLYALSMPS